MEGRYGRGREFDEREYGGQSQPGRSWTYTAVWAITGPHAGRGPKGYQRHDDRIKEEVCECLTQHGQIDAGDIDVKVSNGEVTLTGTVEDRRAKRMAEDAVEAVSGVKEVHNQLRVKQQAGAGTSEGQRGHDSKRERAA